MKTLNIFISLVLVLGLAFTSCDSRTETENSETVAIDKDQFLLDLAEVEKSLELDMPTKGDLQKAVTSFQDFASLFPTDDKAADYLLRASDVALTLGQNQKSVKILGRIIMDYPEYEKMESVYYNRASHTDFELRDTTLARVYYTEFMEKYPTSDFMDDAQARINQNFMSLEDLIESFMKNSEAELAE
jgi:outer membrane protein assembly factor BamD (BamD/ComL family)